MAPRKRQSESLDDGDDENDEHILESASSSLRQNPRKRARTTAAADTESTFSDHDDDEEMAESHLGEVDGLSDDEVVRAANEAQASQFIKRQLQKHPENREVDNGIIEEVRCENFMCHEKLTVKFGPLINFVIGHNGSGKSAVLTAIVVCLGGKAATTNRGTSLKSMIKEGKEVATLSVKIKNQGEDAYRPELYGKSIIVERQFSISGKASFRLKSWQGKLVSKTKRDLDDVIDYFALQLDNPINVLNQDLARQFLSNSSPSDKYKFFIRGTQLEALDADYKLLEETLDNLQVRLDSRTDDLKILEAAATEAESRKKRLEASGSIREEINKTRRMHAWAQVEEQEQLLAKYNDKVTIAERRVQEAEHLAETASGMFEGAEQACNRAEQRVNELEQEMQPATRKLNEELGLFEIGKGKLLDIQANNRTAKADLRIEREKKASLQAQINEERDLLADADGDGHIHRTDRLRQLEQDRIEAESDSSEHAARLPDLQEAEKHAQMRLEAGRKTEQSRKEDAAREQASLESLQQDRHQRFAGYRIRTIQQVVNLMNRESGFKEKPLGPLGLHIKLKDSKWMGLIEKHLGSILDSFVVTSQEDQQLLAKIMVRAKCNASILIGHAAPINTSAHEPAADVVTILRVLDIPEHLVRNQLIVVAAAEQTVLFPDMDQANAYVNAARPVNVKSVLAWTNSGRNDGIKLDWSRSGYKRSGPVPAYHGASRMQTNRDDQIDRQREIVKRAKEAFHRSEQERRRLFNEHEQTKKDIEKHRRTKHEKVVHIQRLQEDIETMKEEIERNQPKDGRLQELERQLEQSLKNEDAQNVIVKDLVTQRAEVDEEQKQLKARCDAARLEVDAHVRAMDAANMELAQYRDTRSSALRKKNDAFTTIADRKDEWESQVSARNDQQRNLDENFIAGAMQVCPRIPLEAGITPAKLDERLSRFERDIRQAEQEAGGTLEEVVNAWKKHKTAWVNARSEYRSMHGLSDTLNRSLSQRKQRWQYFRRYISLRARSMFTYLLAERSFRGKVILDHRNKMLDLLVEPDLTLKSAVGREATTLSGGEKSFSTVCLLLSIWEAMGSPIRCLDEFDVFMDSVNRATSMNMMIAAARRSVGRQFILITPQSMSNIDHSSDINIYKMPDPERGQQVLPYTQGS